MTAIARSISISYGALTFSGASSGYGIEGPVTPRVTYRKKSFNFNVIVFGSSVPDFHTKCQALITQIETPRQDFSLTFGTRTHTYSEANKTGWDISGVIVPVDGSPHNTHVSREYIITISMTTPANLAGDDGVENYTYSHSLGPNGVRRFTVRGVITTDGTILAEAKYEAKITAIVNTVKAAIDPTLDVDADWTENVEDRDIERFDFSMGFKRSFEEKIFKDSVGTPNVPELKFPQITVTPSLIYDANALPDTPRPIEVSIGYSAFVDKQVTQDLSVVWNSHVVELLKEQAELYALEVHNVSEPQINEITPTFSPTGNLISGFIRFTVYGTQNTFFLQKRESYRSTPPVLPVGVYGTSGHQRARLPGLASAFATVTITVIVKGDRNVAYAEALKHSTRPQFVGPPGTPLRFTQYRLLSRAESERVGGSGGGWALVDEEPTFDGPNYAGDPAIAVTSCVLTRVFEYDEDAPLTVPGGNTNIRVSTVAR